VCVDEGVEGRDEEKERKRKRKREVMSVYLYDCLHGLCVSLDG
jgi:hypothetical protein